MRMTRPGFRGGSFCLPTVRVIEACSASRWLAAVPDCNPTAAFHSRYRIYSSNCNIYRLLPTAYQITAIVRASLSTSVTVTDCGSPRTPLRLVAVTVKTTSPSVLGACQLTVRA